MFVRANILGGSPEICCNFVVRLKELRKRWIQKKNPKPATISIPILQFAEGFSSEISLSVLFVCCRINHRHGATA